MTPTTNKTVMFLAGELAEAVGKDEIDGEGFDLSAGLFGTNVSTWLRGVAELVTGINVQGDGEDAPTGTRCAVCMAPQFMTPGGICCPNGHGGADALEEEK